MNLRKIKLFTKEKIEKPPQFECSIETGAFMTSG